MPAQTIATALADQQGWTDATLLDLALTYIDRQGDDGAFADYLNEIAAQESPACAMCAGPGDQTEGIFLCQADCQGDTDHEADEEGEFGPYDWTCSHCGSALNEDNFDETGSRRCYADGHRYHHDLSGHEDEDEEGPVCEDCQVGQEDAEVLPRDAHHGDLLCEACADARSDDGFGKDATGA